MKKQTPIKNERPRKPCKGYMGRAIEQEIKYAAKEFKCSRSFIIAVACAKFFGIKNQEQYY